MITHKLLTNLYKFCQAHKLSQTVYLELACKKISQLTLIAQQNLDEQIDCCTSDKILRINAPKLSIVINTQTPNRQLWYSSTVSGPQRFDYDQKQNKWFNSIGKNIQDVFINDLKTIS